MPQILIDNRSQQSLLLLFHHFLNYAYQLLLFLILIFLRGQKDVIFLNFQAENLV